MAVATIAATTLPKILQRGLTAAYDGPSRLALRPMICPSLPVDLSRPVTPIARADPSEAAVRAKRG